ncbi:MAG: lipoyl synthase [Deltaproteobacteria bacterium]
MLTTRRPEWLQKKVSPSLHLDMDRLLLDLNLHTVCREANCPNITECYGSNRATFLILGTACTRLCSFCSVTKKKPLPPDPGEPERVAEAIVRLRLAHLVITSPTRDDLPDGGADSFVRTVAAIRRVSPQTGIELLIPDFLGDGESIAKVVNARPDIVGHNLETVPRLYHIRQGADYLRSLEVLRLLHELDPELKTKSGIMLGLGETPDEVVNLFRDLMAVGCRYLSIGQYLAPGRKQYPVQSYIRPELFTLYKEQALAIGFQHVESGPYVRSSFNAERYGDDR